jgi:hypothetical protein
MGTRAMTDADPHAARNATNDLPPPSAVRTLLAPWCGIFDIRRGARWMAAGPAWAFWPVLLVAYGVFVAAFVGVAIWDATFSFETRMVPSPPATTAVTTWPSPRWRSVLHQRTVPEVLAEWGTEGLIRAGIPIAIGAGVSLAIVTVAGGFLMLPTVYEGGTVWRAYKRAFAAMCSCWGLFLIAALAAALMITATNHAHYRGWYLPVDPLADYYPVVMAFGMSALLLLAPAWFVASARAVRPPTPQRHLPPRCEGCGYDLTHLPESGRCPECGISTRFSITPYASRPGSPWETGGDWPATTGRVIFKPRMFYSQLRLRDTVTARAPRSFAYVHYVLIFLVAGAVAALCYASQSPRSFYSEPGFVFATTAFAASMTVLLGWLTHRVVVAIVATAWFIRGTLPDPTWARKIMAYETAYLWLPTGYAGLLLASFIIGDSLWMSFLPGARIIQDVTGMPVEPVVWFLGTGLLLAAWFWRYHVAGLATRWSNF